MKSEWGVTAYFAKKTRSKEERRNKKLYYFRYVT